MSEPTYFRLSWRFARKLLGGCILVLGAGRALQQLVVMVQYHDLARYVLYAGMLAVAATLLGASVWYRAWRRR